MPPPLTPSSGLRTFHNPIASASPVNATSPTLNALISFNSPPLSPAFDAIASQSSTADVGVVGDGSLNNSNVTVTHFSEHRGGVLEKISVPSMNIYNAEIKSPKMDNKTRAQNTLASKINEQIQQLTTTAIALNKNPFINMQSSEVTTNSSQSTNPFLHGEQINSEKVENGKDTALDVINNKSDDRKMSSPLDKDENDSTISLSNGHHLNINNNNNNNSYLDRDSMARKSDSKKIMNNMNPFRGTNNNNNNVPLSVGSKTGGAMDQDDVVVGKNSTFIKSVVTSDKKVSDDRWLLL